MKLGWGILLAALWSFQAGASLPTGQDLNASGEIREIEFLAISLNNQYPELDLELVSDLSDARVRSQVMEELALLKGRLLHGTKQRGGLQVIRCKHIVCNAPLEDLRSVRIEGT